MAAANAGPTALFEGAERQQMPYLIGNKYALCAMGSADGGNGKAVDANQSRAARIQLGSAMAGYSAGVGEALFNVYQLDHPVTDESKVLDRRSYVWASLFGPFYVLVNGFPVLALLMIPITAMISVVAFVVFSLADSFLASEVISIVALFVVPVAALAAQGVAAIELIRWGYLRRGWRGGY